MVPQGDFVNAAAGRLGALAAYAHGAHLVFLDGIGLGVGMPLEEAAALRGACHKFLLSQLPPEEQAHASEAAGAAEAASVASTEAAEEASESGADVEMSAAEEAAEEGSEEKPSMWGIAPFFVERGPCGPEAGAAAFDFRAPTTARNAMRVLRAMQLRKAVLLEGSPGVGKTSLVSALARAAGN